VGTLDLILAMLLFLVVVYMVFWANAEAADKMPAYEESQAYKAKALGAADVLLKTPGKPADWETLANASLVKSIGFTSEPSVLEEGKLDAFGLIPEAQARRLLGLSKESYNITVIDAGGRLLYAFGSASEPRASIERLAMLDGEAVIFRLGLS
jgi:hypothetical protein